MPQKNLSAATIDRLIAEAVAIESEAAAEAGALGYMARVMVQTTMPHSKTPGSEYVRSNGALKLTLLAPSETGLPYGSIPRLLLAWLTTEAVRTKSHVLTLGNNLSDFMHQLDMNPTGGRWGSITRLRDQSQRLFTASISCTHSDPNRTDILNIKIASRATLWWKPKEPGQRSLWESTLELDRDFFDEITDRPVPLDQRALKALRGSPMALDTYCWLTYRLSYLKRSAHIPWPLLQRQFGAGYPETAKGRADFKRAFVRHLRKIHALYPGLNLDVEREKLVLHKGRTHIAKR